MQKSMDKYVPRRHTREKDWFEQRVGTTELEFQTYSKGEGVEKQQVDPNSQTKQKLCRRETWRIFYYQWLPLLR